MQRSGRKNPRLKARVEELDRELARMDAEIRAISRATEHPDRESALRRLQHLAAEQGRARDLQTSRAAGRVEGLPDRNETAEPRLAEPQGLAAPEVVPRGGPDPRFANYFVTGSLHSVRPLRQERRVQRNKAIFMLVVAIALLFLVFSMIF